MIAGHRNARRASTRARLLPTALWALGLLGCSSSSNDAPDGAIADGAAASTYLILTSVAATDPYYPAVTKLAAHRKAEIASFDPRNPSAVKPTLVARRPLYVALVLKPEELDVNLARSFLTLSTEIDDDPFSDFAYGFITGATAADCIAFVERIIKAEKEGIGIKPLTVGGWAASSTNMVATAPGSYLSLLKPQSYGVVYLKTGDAQVKTFFAQNLVHLTGKRLLDVGHNGDPHMLWLFEGGNSVSDAWTFDPKLVESPPVQRLGLTSDDVRTLDLYPAVAFNGACHSGVLRRTLVEGDIKATFGDTQGKVRFVEISAGFSFALAMLKTGLTGYFAPIGANNANDSAEDLLSAMLYREPLGEIHKRSIDAIVLAMGGNRPRLKLFTEGESAYQHETLPSGTYQPTDLGFSAEVMLSGKANRIYYGDPLFNPFGSLAGDALRLVTTKTTSTGAKSLRVDLAFKKPATYFPLWDKFHDGGARIHAEVDLPAEYSSGLTVKLVGTSAATRLASALEQHRGKNILHLELSVPDSSSGAGAMDQSFVLSVERK